MLLVICCIISSPSSKYDLEYMLAMHCVLFTWLFKGVFECVSLMCCYAVVVGGGVVVATAVAVLLLSLLALLCSCVLSVCVKCSDCL